MFVKNIYSHLVTHRICEGINLLLLQLANSEFQNVSSGSITINKKCTRAGLAL